MKKSIYFLLFSTFFHAYSMDNIEKLLKAHRVSISQYRYCRMCQSNINDTDPDLNFHLENQHSVCPYCNGQFDNPRTVRNHILDTHATPDMIKSMK